MLSPLRFSIECRPARLLLPTQCVDSEVRADMVALAPGPGRQGRSPATLTRAAQEAKRLGHEARSAETVGGHDRRHVEVTEWR